jgi:hypothetical protein
LKLHLGAEPSYQECTTTGRKRLCFRATTITVRDVSRSGDLFVDSMPFFVQILVHRITYLSNSRISHSRHTTCHAPKCRIRTGFSALGYGRQVLYVRNACETYTDFVPTPLQIVAIVATISLLAAMTALLVFYNGKQPPNWGAYLSLNALLALLSTIFRAMLVVIVSQVISQRKWLWYDCARPLSDLQKFDSGSRGALGAMLLLPTVLLKDVLTSVAASILFASFLVGPFVQQASRTRECSFPVAGQNATLPYTHLAGGGYNCNSPGCTMILPSPDTIVAILSSFTVPTGVENQIHATCTTGNCTFPGGDPMKHELGDVEDEEPTTHSTSGMCSKCVDVASLVSRQRSDFKKQELTTYTLPNSFNFNMYQTDGRTKVHLQTGNLSWMGNLFTPEVKSVSRWAYANVTFLSADQHRVQPDGLRGPGNVTAAVCSLYPCLRTYTASITDNKLVEKEVDAQVMKIDLSRSTPGPLSPSEIRNSSWVSENSESMLQNMFGAFATVKSPCRVAGKLLDVSKNMSSHPGGTKLALYDFTHHEGSAPSHGYTPQYITAPEQCIYRHDPDLVRVISAVFQRSVFNGQCSIDAPNLVASSCYAGFAAAGGLPWYSQMTDIGMKTVISTLYNKGNPNYANISRWFEDFSAAMTNRMRTGYMATAADGNNGTALKIFGHDPGFSGEIQGLAWQTTACVSMHWEWLLFPLILTLLTTSLSIWTIAMNRRHRHSRPVWKESILPLIIYGHKIRCQEPGVLPGQSHERVVSEEDAGPLGSGDVLLEAIEMEDIGEKVAVKFDWPHDTVADTKWTDAKSSAVAPQQGNSWWRRRTRKSTATPSLRPTERSSSRNSHASVRASLLETNSSHRLHDGASSRNSQDVN